VKSEAVAHLAETMLRVAPKNVRTLVETCSIPRWVNEDLLARLHKDEDPRQAYEALAELPFIRIVPEGLALHDQVRRFIHEILRQRSPERYLALHDQCASFHQLELARFARTSAHEATREQRSAVELVYHRLMVEEREGFQLLSGLIGEAMELSRLDFCEALLAEARRHDLDQRQSVWVRYWTGEVAYRRGRWFDALSELEALRADIPSGHPVYIPTCVTAGRIYYQRGRLQDAASAYGETLRLLRQQELSPLRGYVTEQVAKVRRMEGDLTGALESHERALEDSYASDDRYSIASGTGSRGTTLLLLGRLEEGVASLGRSAEASREANYVQFVCTALRSRAIGLAFLGRYQEAQQDATESLQIAERLGDVFNRGFASWALGEVRLRVGQDLEACASALRRAIEDFDATGARFDLGNAYMTLGRYYLAVGEHKQAATCLEKTSELYAGTNFQYGLAWLDCYRAEMWRMLGDLERCLEGATRARNQAESIGAVYAASWARLEQAAARVRLQHSDAARGLAASLVSDQQLLSYNDIAAAAFLLYAETVQRQPADREATLDVAFAALSYASMHSVVTFKRAALALAELLDRTGAATIGAGILSRWRQDGVNGVPGQVLEARMRQSLPGYPFTSLDAILAPEAI
jgi:tetratricopeptide (TPR) repeat protein